MFFKVSIKINRSENNNQDDMAYRGDDTYPAKDVFFTPCSANRYQRL